MYEYLLTHLKQPFPGALWPAPVSADAAALLAMQYQLEKSQYMPAAFLEQQQYRKAGLMLRHVAETVPFYRGRIAPALLKSMMTPERWLKVPLLKREDLQSAGDRIVSTRIPDSHKPLHRVTTSGSTGMPVTAYGTALTRFFWQAVTLRHLLWQQMDFQLKFAAIRPESGLVPGEPVQRADWGEPSSRVVQTGPGVSLSVRTPVEQQIAWLEREKPGYLLSLPTNLRELAASGLKLPGLRGVLSYGELLDAETAALCESHWGVPVIDVYSTQEVGNIALQCPEGRGYHIQAEGVLVELLAEDGRPCAPGEAGRVVVTTLQNLAAPLIRYVIGDYAVAGGPCACGRTLPVLQQVMGRQRNMLLTPDGGRHWPSFPTNAWAWDLPVRQFQFVQKSVDLIEARLVVSQALTVAQEQAVVERLRARFGYPAMIEFRYLDRIERSKGGKFEDFVSEVAR